MNSHKGFHVCEICNKPLSSHWSLNRHKQVKHNATVVKTFEEYLDEKTTMEVKIENLQLKIECLETELDLLKQSNEEHKEKITELSDTIVSIRLAMRENIRKIVLDYLKLDSQ